jgi:hypothetical protein
LFIQDDPENNTPDGLDKEQSRNKFIIYDRQQFNTLAPFQRYSGYLKDLQYVFVNPYTGQLIEK